VKLVFDIVKSGQNVPTNRNFHFNEEGGSIGRNETNSWTLTDAQSYISGQHASIIFMDDTFFIKDESTNGTFLKHPYKKLPKGHPVKINASDIFIIGDHEIQARYSYNEYAQDDIVGSISKSQSSSSLIPDDDFLSEGAFDSFEEVEQSMEDDIMNAFEEAPIIPNDFDSIMDIEPLEEENMDVMEEHISVPNYMPPSAAIAPAVPSNDSELAGALRVLESKLGIDILNLSEHDRNVVMGEIGDTIVNTLEHLSHSLHIKDKTKQDLHLSPVFMDTQSNNPVKLGKAATKLFQNSEGGMMGMINISEAVVKSLREIDTHTISLHSASKNIMKIAANKFAPKQLEYKFESMGSLRGVLPKPHMMWNAYTDMFNKLHEDPQSGVELMANDFTKEYESIAYSMQLSQPNTALNV